MHAFLRWFALYLCYYVPRSRLRVSAATTCAHRLYGLHFYHGSSLTCHLQQQFPRTFCFSLFCSTGSPRSFLRRLRDFYHLLSSLSSTFSFSNINLLLHLFYFAFVHVCVLLTFYALLPPAPLLFHCCRTAVVWFVLIGPLPPFCTATTTCLHRCTHYKLYTPITCFVHAPLPLYNRRIFAARACRGVERPVDAFPAPERKPEPDRNLKPETFRNPLPPHPSLPIRSNQDRIS